jgi:hypothetical protein
MMLTPKIQSAVDTAISRGIGRFDAAPPIHRLLWAVGVQARPPHYASFGNNALLMGGFWGISMAVFFAFFAAHMHPESGAEIIVIPVCVALLAGVAFGLTMAMIFRSRARKAGLPKWDEIGVSNC